MVVLMSAMICALGTSAQEAYAWYSPGSNSLTFCYDNERSICVSTTYDLNDGAIEPGWITDGNSTYVKYVAIDHKFADVRPTSTYHWFYGMHNLESINGMRYLNTSEVTRMDYMFHACYALTSIDLSYLNTTNVTSMSGMFSRCSGMTELDLSTFNTANVETMDYMFNGCTNLTTIYVGTEWSTAAVTRSTDMFYNCTSLVGSMGTSDDPNHKDGEYAHIDGGPSNPGYFTAKNAALRGDVDGDSSVNISDVTALIDYLLSGNASGINLSGADCNQDSSVNISDVTSLIDYLLSGTWN